MSQKKRILLSGRAPRKQLRSRKPECLVGPPSNYPGTMHLFTRRNFMSKDCRVCGKQRDACERATNLWLASRKGKRMNPAFLAWALSYRSHNFPALDVSNFKNILACTVSFVQARIIHHNYDSHCSLSSHLHRHSVLVSWTYTRTGPSMSCSLTNNDPLAYYSLRLTSHTRTLHSQFCVVVRSSSFCYLRVQGVCIRRERNLRAYK